MQGLTGTTARPASIADGADATQGAKADPEATGDGSLVALLKRLRTLLAGGLPAALVGGRLDVNIGASAVTQPVSGPLTDTQLRASLVPVRSVETNGQVYDDSGNLCTVKTAKADVAANQADSSIVAAVGGKRIRVLAYAVMCGGTATTVVFNTKPGGAGTAISPVWQPAANGGIERGGAPGLFYLQTGVGEGLTVTTGAGSTTGVSVTYIEAA